MKTTSAFPGSVFIVILALGSFAAYEINEVRSAFAGIGVFLFAIIVATLVSGSIRVADQWTRGVVLRLGKFRGLEGPGLFFIIPIVESIPYWLDTRVLTNAFKAEKTLTKDTVPVDVDAVLFWKIVDPKRAALDVADYHSAVSLAAQTALREVIGKTMLSDMLEGRDKISEALQKIIDQRSEPWGIQVISVEVKDVLIPSALEDAMSMQAQAERERQARVILGDSERQIAANFGEAAKTYSDNPVALHLRALNLLNEGLKQSSTIVIMPGTAVDAAQLGSMAGFSALASAIGYERPANVACDSSHASSQPDAAAPAS